MVEVLQPADFNDDTQPRIIEARPDQSQEMEEINLCLQKKYVRTLSPAAIASAPRRRIWFQLKSRISMESFAAAQEKYISYNEL